MGWIGWDGMRGMYEMDGTGQDGIGQDRTGQDRMGQDGTGWDRMGWDGTGWDGMVWAGLGQEEGSRRQGCWYYFPVFSPSHIDPWFQAEVVIYTHEKSR